MLGRDASIQRADGLTASLNFHMTQGRLHKGGGRTMASGGIDAPDMTS